MRAQGPVSSGLLSHLKSQKQGYDAFLFFGYLYATTYFGLPIVAEKAFLVPCAHDEWPIHLPMWDAFIRLPRGLIFNTPEERRFFQRRFSSAQRDGPTIGIGVDAPPRFDVPAFREKYSLREPFLLYVGRIDPSKGCAELFDFFRELRKADPSPRKLLLLGRDVMAVPYHPDIIHLGFVADDEKFAAMAACDWLVIPSPYESLSIVLLETWVAGRPALVNASCDVLVGQCQRSNGGLWYSNYAEWSRAIRSVDSRSKSILGRQGKTYVQANYTWDRMEARYKATVENHFSPDTGTEGPESSTL